jgi:hypothetical protein
MSGNSEANIATADALTLLLHNQHALAAAIEEVALWVRANGSSEIHENAATALQMLDVNASAITDGDQSNTPRLIFCIPISILVTLAGERRACCEKERWRMLSLYLYLSETTIARNWPRSDTRQLRFKLPHYKLLKNC